MSLPIPLSNSSISHYPSSANLGLPPTYKPQCAEYGFIVWGGKRIRPEYCDLRVPHLVPISPSHSRCLHVACCSQLCPASPLQNIMRAPRWSIMRPRVGALCVVSRVIMRLGFWLEARIFHEDSVFQGKHYASKSVALCVPPLQHYASFRWSIMRRLVGALCVVFPWHLRMDFIVPQLTQPRVG